jgi:hypothetical protein
MQTTLTLPAPSLTRHLLRTIDPHSLTGSGPRDYTTTRTDEERELDRIIDEARRARERAAFFKKAALTLSEQQPYLHTVASVYQNPDGTLGLFHSWTRNTTKRQALNHHRRERAKHAPDATTKAISALRIN